MKTPRLLKKSALLFGAILSTLSAQAAQGPQPTICTRSCWSARAPGCSITQMGALTRAIIHHTAGASDYTTNYETGKAKVRGVQNIHMDGNGWCDIGYHFLVTAGGHIYEGRSGSMSSWPQGAHDGANGNSFGFNCMGNFADSSEGGGANQIPTIAMMNSLYDVIAWRMPSAWSPYGSGSYNGNTVGYLDGHRKVKSTACPGNNIHNVYITSNYSGGPARDGINCRKNGGCSTTTADIASPSIITRSDGKVFAFALDTDAGLVKYRTKTGVAGSWGSWVNLAGSGFEFLRGLAIDNGGCAVFGMGGGNIFYKYLASSGAGVWSSWVSLTASGFSSIAPVMRTDGKMALVGCGSGTTIYYREQTGVGPAAAWTGWTDLAASSFFEVDALPLPNGGVAVFGVGNGSGAWYKYKASSNATWSGWANLGGSGFARLSAVKTTGGKMAFFGCSGGAGSPIYYQEQTAVGASASWSGWINLGGSGFSSISGVALPNNGLAVFGCTDNGSGSTEFYKVRTSGTWGGYVDLGASNVRRVAATADSTGLMTTVMRGGPGAPLYERRQTDATHWAGWVNLGGTLK